jgi:DNA-binding IclR family transcriptional regulator
MTSLAAAALRHLQTQSEPLSLIELLEDLGLDEFDEWELTRALRELLRVGLVRRIPGRGRGEHPFYECKISAEI